MRARVTLRLGGVALALLSALACSGAGSENPGSTGGAPGAGGTNATTGGTSTGGGLATTGGAVGSSGAATNGGSGGSTAGGATATTGGVVGSGGVATSGGNSGNAAGGNAAGGSATGGAVTTGGSVSTTGGAVGSGGNGPGGSGGTKATGGAGSGGKAASGGSAGSGAMPGTGGGGADPVVDDQGCPLTLEGFATLEGGVTGGKGGSVVTVSTQSDLEKYAASEAAYVIRVQGTIKLTPAGREVPVKSNKSIIGLGTTGKIDEGGFFLGSGVHNVIFRNLTIGGTGHYAVDDPERKNNDWDGIQMDTAHHVWIDHVFFQDVYDGMIDVRSDSNFVTLSWNRFKDHMKTVGIGWTTNLVTQITLHHNWFDNCEKRNPNCDNAYCHSYNNILEGVDEQGSLAYGSASLRIENGVFRNSNRPWYAAESTAKVTQTGSITENIMNAKANGEAFKPTYPYKLDPASAVDDLVKRCVGPRPLLGQ